MNTKPTPTDILDLATLIPPVKLPGPARPRPAWDPNYKKRR